MSFRTRVKRADAVLFATPEYNRSIPGVLKNAIDVGSRPYGANHHLRQSLVFLDMPTLQQPEAYIGHADKLFDPSGAFVNASTAEFCAKFLKAFDAWIKRQVRPAV